MKATHNLQHIGREFVLLLGLHLLAVAPLLGKHNDDVVIMKNGDRLTGEVKRLEAGILYFKPGYSLDAIALDWREVQHLESKDYYSVDTTDGQRLTGEVEASLIPEGSAEVLKIKSSEGDVNQLTKPNVVAFRPEEDRFWKRLNGSIDYGFNFTQGNSQTQSTLSSDVNYRTLYYRFHADGSSILSRQSDGTNTTRNTLNITLARYLTRGWFVGGISNFLTSDQQELKLRATVGGGVGRDLFRTYRSNLSMVGGAVFTNEHYRPESGREPRVNNVEALVAVVFKTRTFEKTMLESRTEVYPNFTTLGRLRVNTHATWKVDLIGALSWRLTAFENFDSKPPVNAPRNDSGVSTSLGWSF